MRTRNLLGAAIAAALLAGCGGAGTGVAGPGGTPAGPDQPRLTGALLQNPPGRTDVLTAAGLRARMQNGPTRDQTLLKLAGDPICDVEVRYLQYTTTGGAGEPTSASGALMTPGGSDFRCTGARPVVLYAHATHPEKNFNLANLGDNTNAAYTESLTVAAIFAARGYIVVAPNSAGYDSSTLGYHPFLNAKQQSGEMLDAMAAAKTALTTFTPRVTASTQLFLTGYSQGGYVALATQRALEQAGVTVTASAPMSGPFTNTFRLAYLQDLLAHPFDPGFGLRIDAKANDLRGFTPQAPVFLCGGSRDATVSFETNSLALGRAFAGLGPNRVLLLDIDAVPANPYDQFFTERLNFALLVAATREQARETGGDAELELARNYHAAVFPFCASAVGKFFGKF